MPGQLVYIMGPSGSGKDSLLQQVAQHAGSRVHLMKRYITRSAESEGEDAFSVSAAEFDAMEARGEFAMRWRANGLAYGIPATLDTLLEQGIPSWSTDRAPIANRRCNATRPCWSCWFRCRRNC